MPNKSKSSAIANTGKSNLAQITITFAVSQDTTVVSVVSTVSLDEADTRMIEFISNLVHQSIIRKVLTKTKK